MAVTGCCTLLDDGSWMDMRFVCLYPGLLFAFIWQKQTEIPDRRSVWPLVTMTGELPAAPSLALKRPRLSPSRSGVWGFLARRSRTLERS